MHFAKFSFFTAALAGFAVAVPAPAPIVESTVVCSQVFLLLAPATIITNMQFRPPLSPLNSLSAPASPTASMAFWMSLRALSTTSPSASLLQTSLELSTPFSRSSVSMSRRSLTVSQPPTSLPPSTKFSTTSKSSLAMSPLPAILEASFLASTRS